MPERGKHVVSDSVLGCARAGVHFVDRRDSGEEHRHGVRGFGVRGYRPGVGGGSAMAVSECQVVGCDREGKHSAQGLTVCFGHWRRNHRTGEFGSPHFAKRRKSRGTCTVTGCGDTDCGLHGYCLLHYTRWKRHGDPLTVIPPEEREVQEGEANNRWTGDAATYAGIHQRVRAKRGKASEYECTDCSARAAQWSYTHEGGGRERPSEFGPYSVSIYDYVPRCVKCHKRHDLEQIKRRGAVEGVG